MPEFKTQVAGQLVISGGVDNLGATLNSKSMNIESRPLVAVHIKVNNTTAPSSATAVGRIRVQVSNDPSTIGWSDYQSLSILANSNVECVVELETGTRFLRVRYERTSGNGILDVFAHGKSYANW